MLKKHIKYIILLLCIPTVIGLGNSLFDDRQYAFITLAIVILSSIPFFLTFENNNRNTYKMVIIAVMVAMSVAGRFIFAVIPGFKPITAIVVITAIYFGCEVGFLTGSLSAVISNFYFGQGPWTPFQMFTWGLIGLLAGKFSFVLKTNRFILAIYGALVGILYSFLMDIWTVLWYDNQFHIKLYLVAIVSSLPYTMIYAISNIIFLLCLAKPIGDKLLRIKSKYGIN